MDRRALRLYRENFWTIALVSAVVFAPLSLFSAIVNQQAEHWVDDSGITPLFAVVVFVASALMIFGYALCSGLLDKMVVGPEFGHPRESLSSALRSLPYARLIGLDLLTTIAITVGLLLGLVPGILLFTLVALAPPLLISEQRGVWSAMRRSASLVRRAFAATFVVVTLPVAVEHQVFAGLELLTALPLLSLWALHLVAAVFILAVVVLCETTLAFTLVQEERAEASVAPTEQVA